MVYEYCLDPHKLESGRKVRFCGKVENIDRISGVFLLNNGITKVSCIPSDKEIVRGVRVGDIVRVFGKVMKITEESEIEVHFLQKLRMDLRIYNKVVEEFLR